MMNKYTYWRCLTALMLVMAGVCACTDELAGLEINTSRPSDVICFTASLSDTRSASQTRSASGHLEIEQEEWLVGMEKKQDGSRGAPVSLLSGSAGVIGFGDGDSQWSDNVKYVFDGDELTAAPSVVPSDVRWSTLVNNNNVFCHVYAPYNSSIIDGKKIKYQVPGTVEEQQDLIVASWTGVKGTNYGKDNKGEDIQPQTIPLVFEHALTAIKFKVGFDCTVTKLEVKGIYKRGTYTFGEGWEVDKTSDNPTSNYEFKWGDGKKFNLNEFLTDGEKTLMMIPQTLPEGAEVVLTYDNGKTISSSLEGKVWQEGKMITYTIHKDQAPSYIYFDLAAGNVEITETGFSGKVYESSSATEATNVTGTHASGNRYYVYQSTSTKRSERKGITTISEVNDKTIYTHTPLDYPLVTYNGQLWSDYITNNTSVAGVIQAWNKAASTVARESTDNRIQVYGSGIVVNLTIDNIYTNYAERSMSRTTAGIGFNAGSNSKLTIKTIGDNRVSAIHYHGGNNKNNQLIFEGTGSLTVCAASGKTKFYNDTYVGETKENDTTFIDNHWCSAIGGNDSGEGNSCGIVINSGNIFAGTTKAENCTAIGAGGNDKGVITINGGNVTAVATTTGTAIGGGIGFNSNGGEGNVTINGGNVYAYNHRNRWSIPSSAIGGAGSSAAKGTEGKVYINGGYVYAYSALGTAIGGGSSKTNIGGNANVTIKGGQIIAKSGSGTGIGGGTGSAFENNYNGGNAIITISGNPIIRTGSIGGGGKGPQSTGTIGAASITIEENCNADIQAQFVLAAGIASSAENKFEMKGGTIRNSYVDDEEYLHIQKKGGAVYLEDGTFTMSGGTIKNCSAVQGGAVYINSQSGTSTFTMKGGEIHSCFATGGVIDGENNDEPYLGHGGAVCLVGGNVNMSGGKIRNNYSENGDGGAVYINNGNFSMFNSSTTISDNYPTITGNAAHKGNGGGVFVSSENGKSVKVDLFQGIITNNTANNYGGGICVDMGNTENAATVTVGADRQGDANPEISGNMAMMSGGGLYVRGTNADVTIYSGMIAENKVSAYVKNQDVANEMGGVTLNAGSVTHVEVIFDGNGGTFNNATTYKQNIVTNTNSKLTKNRFDRALHTFTGWNTRRDGLGESYKEEDPRPHSSNITLYAQWKAK